jgi:hypothetical protein
MRFSIIVTSLAVGLVTVAAQAQQGQGRGGGRGGFGRQQQMSPEQKKTAWQWQVKELSQSMKLSFDQSMKLLETYLASRKGLEAAIIAAREEAREARGEGGQGQGQGRGQGRGGFGGGAFTELTDEHREQLAGKVQSLLAAEQAETAMAALGTYSTEWDRMVNMIAGFGLEKEQVFQALTPVRLYVVETASLRRSDDREAMRAGTRAARENLNDALASVLSEEQMSEMQRANRGRGRRGFSAERLLEYDENGDGKLEKDELPERMQRMFDRLDQNGDGVIDAEELKAMEERFGGGRRPRDDF